MNEVISPIYFEEIWKPITSKSVPLVIENAYIISDEGRVYSYLSNSFLTPIKTNNGYYRVALRLQNNTCRYFLIHRIVMIEHSFDHNYQSLQINHFNGDKSINKIWNLHWCTPSENIIHAYRTGLKVKEKGEDCTYSTITNKQAEEIAQMLVKKDLTCQQIADIIGCSRSVVQNISTGSTWKEVYNKYNLSAHKKKICIIFV